MSADAGIFLCYYSTQDEEGSSQVQRRSVTRPAPAAQQGARQRRDDTVGFVGDTGAAVWQGGMSMRGGRAARTIHLYNVAQAARPRRSAVRAGRACRTSSGAHRVDRADASVTERNLRDQ